MAEQCNWNFRVGMTVVADSALWRQKPCFLADLGVRAAGGGGGGLRKPRALRRKKKLDEHSSCTYNYVARMVIRKVELTAPKLPCSCKSENDDCASGIENDRFVIQSGGRS